jgi:hypothetical protein
VTQSGHVARSPSLGKFREILRRSRNHGRSCHQHQRETPDDHAFKASDEECAQMGENGQISSSTNVRDAKLLVTVHTPRLSCLVSRKSANIHTSAGLIRGIPV